MAGRSAYELVVRPDEKAQPAQAGRRGQDELVERHRGRARIGPEGEVQVFGADEQNRAEVDIDRWVGLAPKVRSWTARWPDNDKMDMGIAHVLIGCGLGGGSLINAAVGLRPDARVFADAASAGE